MTASSTHELHELIDDLSQATTVEDIRAVCARLCPAFGFEHFIYGARVPTSSGQPAYIIVNGYPQQWRLRYIEQDYLSIDPVVEHCTTRLTPLRWEAIAPQEKENETVRRFMGEAREFGLKSGVSFPVHSPYGEAACLSLAVGLDHPQARERIHHALPSVQLFAAYLHETARNLLKLPAIPRKPRLTQRERECLLWATEGAHFGHRERPDRSMVNAQIGAS